MPYSAFTDFDDFDNVNSLGDNEESSVQDFPDFAVDWPDIMANLGRYQVADRLSAVPGQAVVSGEIYQFRVVYAIKQFSAWPTRFVATGRTPFVNRSAERMAH